MVLAVGLELVGGDQARPEGLSEVLSLPGAPLPARVANTIDPLGGSYFVEALTDEIEAKAYESFRKIDEYGGMVQTVKQAYPQREIADA